jgi:hypothetical protein
MKKRITTMNFDYIILTGGQGGWSKLAKEVHVIDVSIENRYELRVYFDTTTWNVKTDGLIYGDQKFLDGVCINFSLNGFSDVAIDSIDYSEQDMQGDDYVSMDIGKRFRVEWEKKWEEVGE